MKKLSKVGEQGRAKGGQKRARVKKCIKTAKITLEMTIRSKVE